MRYLLLSKPMNRQHKKVPLRSEDCDDTHLNRCQHSAGVVRWSDAAPALPSPALHRWRLELRAFGLLSLGDNHRHPDRLLPLTTLTLTSGPNQRLLFLLGRPGYRNITDLFGLGELSHRNLCCAGRIASRTFSVPG